MPAPSPFASARAAAALFRLPLRDAAWRGPQGGVSGRGAGASPDFEDHRPYFPGDDIRHINWQVYARTGAYTMKVFRAEVSPSVDLLLDVSPSMFLDAEKARRTRELAIFCAESAVGIGASLRIHTLDAGRASPLARESLADGSWPTPSDRPAGAPPDPALAPLRPGSMRVLVSDLLFPASRPLAVALVANRGRGVVFAPHCAAESDPDWSGNHEFEDAEGGARERRRVTPDIRRRYGDAYARHFELWRDTLRRHGVRTARIAAAASLMETLRRDALPTGAVEAWR